MTDFTIYSGEDFSLYLSATQDDAQTAYDLTNYKVIVQLSVDNLGIKIIASTEDDASGLELVRGDDGSSFSLHVANQLTSNLSDGVIYLSILFENQSTSQRSIAEIKTIGVKHSKLTV